MKEEKFLIKKIDEIEIFGYEDKPLQFTFTSETNNLTICKNRIDGFDDYLMIFITITKPNLKRKGSLKENLRIATIYSKELGYEGLVVPPENEWSKEVFKVVETGIKNGWLLEKRGHYVIEHISK